MVMANTVSSEGEVHQCDRSRLRSTERCRLNELAVLVVDLVECKQDKLKRSAEEVDESLKNMGHQDTSSWFLPELICCSHIARCFCENSLDYWKLSGGEKLHGGGGVVIVAVAIAGLIGQDSRDRPQRCEEVSCHAPSGG
jgi:hypothetical protein